MMYRFLMICFICLLMSCYVYKPMEQPEPMVQNTSTSTKSQKKTKKKKSKPVLLTKDEAIQSLKQDVYYKVDIANDRSYKIRYKESDRDSIYGHKKNCDKKPVSIAKKDIEGIKDRRFSKLQSDLITFPILGGLAVGLLIIVL